MCLMPSGDNNGGGPDAVARFAKTLTFPTISSIGASNHVKDPETFQALHDYYREAYPIIWQKLKAEQVSRFWQEYSFVRHFNCSIRFPVLFMQVGNLLGLYICDQMKCLEMKKTFQEHFIFH